MKARLCLAALVLAACASAVPQRDIPAPRSGIAFTSDDVRRLQADDADNPGMLWVTRGEVLWREPAGAGRASCASCHGAAEQSMRGVATRYPVIDRSTGALLNLEGRIDQCRAQRQRADSLRYESEELLALTSFVAYQSRGLPLQATIAGAAAPHFEAGRAQYVTRQGQLNLSCANCHERNWGRTMLAETVSQGHGNGFPAYRLEWQGLGSLHRRLRACQFGIRAEPAPAGSQSLVDLELYLAWRATGLPVEAPGVRR
ncbi:MAG: sulfur oxidation c-type cytochrome SoxA [Betaproteobacteria bacterium]